MKSHAIKIIFTFILFACFYACEPVATFNEPQPANTGNLRKIPKRLQGHYVNVKGTSSLNINDSIIQIAFNYDFKIHPKQLDSTIKLSGDTLINLKTDERVVIKKVGDSLQFHSYDLDTLFHMSKDNVLKKFKGYYFISNRFGKDGWEVKKIELSKGKLTISTISAKTDIDNLKVITESPMDTVPPYKFVATKKQFKLFIKNNGFGDTETFIRQ